MARLISYAVDGVQPELMGIGPVKAVKKVTKQGHLALDDISLFELNNAFSAQAISVIQELGLKKEIVNVNGGAKALDHPSAAPELNLRPPCSTKWPDDPYFLDCAQGASALAGTLQQFLRL